MSYTNTYIRGLRLAEISNSAATRQYTFNAHGDVTGLVDTTTGAVTDYTYDAYGNEDNASATDTNPFRYSGEYYDAETGFIYLRARYYDPSIGRFTAEDPIRDGTNWYVYCYNNPVKYVDPWGVAPGDYFKTRNEAAADFGFYTAMTSFKLGEELASAIYKTNENGEIYYYYDEPRNDLKTHSEREITFYIHWSETPISLIHTHGIYDSVTSNTKDFFSTPDNVLSGNPDISDIAQSNELRLDYYLVSPVGNLRLYTSGSNNPMGQLIRSDLPRDPRYEINNTLLGNLLRWNFPKATDDDFVNARINNPDSWLNAIKDLEEFR